jgi:Kef-type K+ transport system membrane component KefB
MDASRDAGKRQKREDIFMRAVVLYVAMLLGATLLFLLINAYGQTLSAPPGLAQVPKESVNADGQYAPLVHVLLTLTAVVALGWLLGQLFRYLGQPPVIGEVVAGIVLGPSVLGLFFPQAAHFLLPASVAPFLSVIAQLGVIIYMFLVGLDLNLDSLKERTQATITIAHTGMVIPFLLGAMLALLLFPRLSSSDVAFTSFALFLGVAMAITAFPVLARILTDRRMQKTPLGVTALACAALGDATAWCLLAFVVGGAQSKVSGAVVVIGLTVLFIAFMFLIVRPLAARLLTSPNLTRGMSALIFVVLLLSALATEFIGVQAIFGAFLLGAVIPHDSAVAREFTHKLEDLVTVLLLPAFFAFTGLRTQIGLVSGLEEWLICLLIIAVATAGKFGGTLLAARVTGLGWRESSALGILMNTRGLMELIVLNIGLDLKVISPTLFAMMVLMALVTTIATTPLLQAFQPRSP